MIQFSNEHTESLIRQMWKVCFEDTDEFIDLFFTRQYRHENTLVYFEGGVATASLQMIPYSITFYGREIPFAYLAGLCTLPEHRKKGYMAQLIELAHQVLQERGVPLSILVPAEEWLFGFYEKFGYRQVFDKSEEPVYSLDTILKDTPNIESAYLFFDSMYRYKDFCVQKSFSDFQTIVEEYRNDGSPEKYNLAGMALILDEEFLLGLYATKNPSSNVCIKVEESSYKVANGVVDKCLCLPDVEVDKAMLCRLLFGYKTNQLEEPLKSLFPEHHPIMNLMLE